MTGGESNAGTVGSFALGHWRENRVGYGAMQLAGDTSSDHPETATKHYACYAPSIDSGINHIDTPSTAAPRS